MLLFFQIFSNFWSNLCPVMDILKNNTHVFIHGRGHCPHSSPSPIPTSHARLLLLNGSLVEISLVCPPVNLV